MDHSQRDARIFGANLRTLCERQGSISAICRKIAINRQQFNKYLSGTHVPSDANLRLIANHFGLSTAILFSDPDELRTLVDGNFFHAMMTAKQMQKMPGFVSDMVVGTTAYEDDLVGVYDRYQYSSIYKGSVLKSVFCIYRNGEFLQHYYVERFPSYDAPNKAEYIFKYYGLCFALEDRVFTIDVEGIQKNEMTSGVFAAVKRNTKKFMYGIGSGIAATQFRQPYATKVVLHYRGPGLIKREHLAQCTVLEATSPRIPREVLQYLGEDGDMIYSR
ncbi:XRE family transcriptional regulator [Rhizobium sp. RMa-01]|uniref:helix-turn-helix domain-containing protein n=1 Tax=unclassified Rhizobium TaxID=2613769 RepID=UPI000A448A58|nr:MULTISPECIES: helix-turn-helix transcriptional regulator [unclassified Rhizobium]RVU09814.1 XRE family transcriptional regulator [Rhizobium sp. RMa-01]